MKEYSGQLQAKKQDQRYLILGMKNPTCAKAHQEPKWSPHFSSKNRPAYLFV